MTILFIGNFDVDYTTETHHKKTFEKLGHNVIPFQENRSRIHDILVAANDADMVYYTHTHSFRLGTDKDVADMFRCLKEMKIPTVGFHLDLWLGLEREKDLKNDPYWNLDYFFTVDKLMADWLNENTNTKGFYLPAGVYEDECYMAEPDYNRFPHEIIFTGSYGYHKEYPYRQQLIDWLHRTYGDRFAHYGGGGKPVMRGHDLNTLYASAGIVIGDTLCKDFNYPYYFSDRLFEVPGRGGFMIFPWIKGLEFLFYDGELQTYKYGDFEGLRRTIDFYMGNDVTREHMKELAHQRVKKSHTYTNRLKQLLEILEKEKATI